MQGFVSRLVLLIIIFRTPPSTLPVPASGINRGLDDRFDIAVKIRATVQAAIGVIMMVVGGLYLRSLGYVFGLGISSGSLWLLPDAFAVWAAINAFNMVDGIDGLLGGLSSVSFAAIGIILWFDGQYSPAMWCFAMIAAILPYILLNLGALGRRYKVFMGMRAVR